MPDKSKEPEMQEIDWRKGFLSPHSTFRQAIQNLDQSELQITLVVTPQGTLIGTLTDGDIRRGLLKGLSIDGPIDEMVNREPLVVPPDLSRDLVLQLMQVNKVNQLPVLDENRCIVGLHLWNKLMEPCLYPNLMIIMAGGKGTRLLPYTKECPKPMLEVDGKPMLEHIIERARGEGFQHFLISIHYLGHIIEDYFGDGSSMSVKIEYLKEESPLGTAGAIGSLNPRPEAPFLVTNGDVLTDVRYGEMLEFHSRHGAAGTMAVRLYEWQNPFGVVHTKGIDIVGFEEKPVSISHINAGVYVLEPSSLNALTVGEYCDMTTLFDRLKNSGSHTIVYPMHEPWLDVGSIDDLKKSQDGVL